MFIAVEDTFEIAVGKEHATAEEDVRTVAGELFEARKELRGDFLGSKVADEFGVVDGHDGAVGGDGTLNIPRIDDLRTGGGGGSSRVGDRVVREVRILEGGRLEVGGGHREVWYVVGVWRGSLWWGR